MTRPIKLKLVDAAGKALPSELSAFKDEALAAYLLRVNVLPFDFDQSMNLLIEDRRMMLACLQYEVSIA